MSITPTSDCPVYPPHLRGSKPILPRRDLSDGEIDTFCQYIADLCGLSEELASTQYGRRVLVDAFLRYSAPSPIEGGVPVPSTYSRNQPR